MPHHVPTSLTIADFFSTDPIPPDGVNAVLGLLEHGQLFRYIPEGPEHSEAALLERDFAHLVGAKFALSVNSCSSAIFLSLIASGVRPGDKILMSAFTFAAVPSSIIHAGAVPVLVECDQSFHVDLDDLSSKLRPGIKALVLSHMRGHTSDLDAVKALCDRNGTKLIEDAAHGLGSRWKGRPVGTIGDIGCFSFQSYKLLNGGEGGILVTDNEDVIIKAVYLSGAYEKNWQKHFGVSKAFEHYQNSLPLYNLRMSDLSAAVVRAQIATIDDRVKRGNERYMHVAAALSASPHIFIPTRDPREEPAPDSIQFSLVNYSDIEVARFISLVRARGVSLYVFGFHENNARVFWNWHFLEHIPELPLTRSMLMRTCDVRLPLSFSMDKCAVVAEIILTTLKEVKSLRA